MESLKSRKLLLLTAAPISALYYLKKRRLKSVRKHWVRPFLRNRTEYGDFSFVLMATCDARYSFTAISIGSAGSESDGGIFSRSRLGKQLRDHSLPLPAPKYIAGTPLMLPYVFVGDQAFPLLINLMRPFPGCTLENEKRIFNYRLSRARRTIENTFGILVARWRVLLNTMQMLPEYATNTIKSCLVFHNHVRQHPFSGSLYMPPGFVDSENYETGETTRGLWRNLIPSDSLPFTRQASNNYSHSASDFRNFFKFYFNGPGRVPWQESLCNFSG